MCVAQIRTTHVYTHTHTRARARANRASRCARTVGECTIIPRRSRSCLKKMENGLLRKRKKTDACVGPRPMLTNEAEKLSSFLSPRNDGSRRFFIRSPRRETGYDLYYAKFDRTSAVVR